MNTQELLELRSRNDARAAEFKVKMGSSWILHDKNKQTRAKHKKQLRAAKKVYR